MTKTIISQVKRDTKLKKKKIRACHKGLLSVGSTPRN